MLQPGESGLYPSRATTVDVRPRAGAAAVCSELVYGDGFRSCFPRISTAGFNCRQLPSLVVTTLVRESAFQIFEWVRRFWPRGT